MVTGKLIFKYSNVRVCHLYIYSIFGQTMFVIISFFVYNFSKTVIVAALVGCSHTTSKGDGKGWGEIRVNGGKGGSPAPRLKLEDLYIMIIYIYFKTNTD